jgi:hypothetical protein
MRMSVKLLLHGLLHGLLLYGSLMQGLLQQRLLLHRLLPRMLRSPRRRLRSPRRRMLRRMLLGRGYGALFRSRQDVLEKELWQLPCWATTWTVKATNSPGIVISRAKLAIKISTKMNAAFA